MDYNGEELSNSSRMQNLRGVKHGRGCNANVLVRLRIMKRKRGTQLLLLSVAFWDGISVYLLVVVVVVVVVAWETAEHTCMYVFGSLNCLWKGMYFFTGMY